MTSSAKRSSGIGVADQYEMDQMAEAELIRLQRQVSTRKTNLFVNKHP